MTLPPADPGAGSATRSAVALLLLLAAAAFFVRVWEADLYDDALLYAAISRDLAAGDDWLTPRWGGDPYFKKPPLVFWLTAIDFRIFGVGTVAAVFWSPASAAVAVLLTYFLARRWFPEWVAVLSGVVLGTTPRFIKDSLTLRLDSPLTALLLGAWLAAFVAAERRPRFHLVAGLCTGLAVLTKGPIGMLGLAPYPLLLWLRPKQAAARAWWVRGEPWAGLAIAVGLPGAWYAAMLARHGEAFLRVALLSEGVERVFRNFGEENRWAYVRMLLSYHWPWLPFLAVGIALYLRELRRRERWEGTYLLLFGVGYLALISMVETKYYRYFQPLYPFLAMLAALSLARVLPAARRRGFVRGLGAGAAAALLLLNLLPLRLHRERNGPLAAEARAQARRGDEVVAVSAGAADHNVLSALRYFGGLAPRELEPHYFSAPPPSERCVRLLFLPPEQPDLRAEFALGELRTFRNERRTYAWALACRAAPAAASHP